ncbi:MAG: hypothetical protein R3C56_12510 [Pirellulaceae bacterium]
MRHETDRSKGCDGWPNGHISKLACLRSSRGRHTALRCRTASSAPEAVDTVVVRPAAWAERLQPWKAYREAQGHHITELDSAADSRTARGDRQVALRQPSRFATCCWPEMLVPTPRSTSLRVITTAPP